MSETSVQTNPPLDTVDSPSDSRVLDTTKLLADPTVRAVGDLAVAEFRAATVQVAGLDPAALAPLLSDPLVSALSARFQTLPSATQVKARGQARVILQAPPTQRSVLGPLSRADLTVALAPQVAEVRRLSGITLHLASPVLRSDPAIRSLIIPPGPIALNTKPVQVGVFLDRLHCFDLTGLGLEHDRITLLASGVDPEQLDPDDLAHSITAATFGQGYDMGYFSKGDDWPRPFPQPGGRYFHYTEHRTAAWPKTYVTTITLVQHNPGASTTIHDDLVQIDNAIRGKLIDALAGLSKAALVSLAEELGLDVGALGGPIGAIIGAAVGALVGYVVTQVLDWIESYFEDWYFSPASFRLGQKALLHAAYDWPQHHADVYGHSGHYSIDLHHYRRPLDAQGNPAG